MEGGREGVRGSEREGGRWREGEGEEARGDERVCTKRILAHEQNLAM